MTETLRELGRNLLDAARRAGADGADVLVAQGISVVVDTRNGALEHTEREESLDFGLRVLLGRRQALVSGSDRAPGTIARMAERAVAMAREAPEDPWIGLAEPAQLASDWDLEALELADPADEPEPALLQEAALRAEEAARAVDGVSQVDVASASYGRDRIHLAASNGFCGGYERTSNTIYAVAISGQGAGMERDAKGESRVFRADLPTPEAIGREAGERAAARAGARQPPTGTWPVLYDRRVSASLIGHLLAAVNGTAIARGASWLRDALGQVILPEDLSLVEEPLRPRVYGSRPFDAEGLARSERRIVERGRLTGWTLDLATGRKLGMESTANAARSTAAPPAPAISNVTLSPGRASHDELLRDMGSGLLITGFMGSTINPTTGEYSRGASGFWVENGEIAWPVSECTIAGNLREMLGRIVPANDAEPHLSHRVPSLLIDAMVLAGA